MSESCKSCRFFNPEGLSYRGDCRAHPTIIPKTEYDWCGEYEAKAVKPLEPVQSTSLYKLHEAMIGDKSEQAENIVIDSRAQRAAAELKLYNELESDQPRMVNITAGPDRHLILEDDNLWACNRCGWSMRASPDLDPRVGYDKHVCSSYKDGS